MVNGESGISFGSEKPFKVLLVEDMASDADLIIRFLKRENVPFTFLRVWDREAYVTGLDEFDPDIIISDCILPQFNGMEAFHILKEQNRTIPFVLMSGSISEKLLTQYMKEGIDEYILKDNLLRLPSAIEKVMNKNKIDKLNLDLNNTNVRLQRAYDDLKDSIHYAEKIQIATLPDTAALRSAFPESFILYKPKDILSGDFFWFERKDDQFFIAVADCTGHGIPGALLSIMGSNLLNEAFFVKKVTRPAEILNRLNKRVRKILKHDKSLLHDGMDIILCSINLNTNVIEFAGANRSLYITNKGQCREMGTDRVAIGENEDSDYTNHSVNLEIGDRIFLFTDGFADQFSAKSNKKMTKKRLVPLLTKTSLLDIVNQEKIVNSFFEEWKGNKEQVDDVLLVGMEIGKQVSKLADNDIANQLNSTFLT
jgi:sigma-B regulation protein RsbU (phosphoserine phosphatase)